MVAQAAGTTADLYGVDFINADDGWAVGNSGTIVATTDGGAEWTAQTSPTTKDLRGVHFVDQSDGWAAGGDSTNAVTLATTDGGTTWISQSSVATSQLLGVAAVDADHAWTYNEGEIDATTDGGASWATQTTGLFCDATFLDASTGWAVYSDEINETTDGGSTWTTSDTVPGAELYGVSFADALHGVAVGTVGLAGDIETTTDGGSTWTSHSVGSSPMLAVSCAGADSLAVGESSALAVSTDSGGSWALRSSGHTDVLNSVAFSPPDALDSVSGDAAGDSNSMFSIGLGQAGGTQTLSWSVLATPYMGLSPTSIINGISMPDAYHCWLVGPQGAVLHWQSGWQLWNAANAYPNFAVDFCDDSNGWVVGSQILHTTDGGLSWATYPTSVPTLYGVSAANATHCWAVGIGGTVEATTDGGTVWAEQPSATSSNLWSVSFADAQDGWAVGSAGTIIHTTDGGSDWTVQRTAPPGQQWPILTGVASVTSQEAYAVGEQGTILHTTDGGQAWTPEDSGTDLCLNSVSAPAADAVFAVGNGGAVLALDARPPNFFLSNANCGWVKGPVTTDVWSSDVFSGVKEVDYSTDAGQTWTDVPLGGATYADSVPITVTNQGLTTISCRAVDEAGNVSAVSKWPFEIDNSRPVTVALNAVSAKAKHSAVFKYRVNDAVGAVKLCPTATVSIVIKKLSGAKVATISLGKRATNQALSYSWKCRIRAGKYRYYVYATNAVGSTQSKVGHNNLTVH